MRVKRALLHYTPLRTKGCDDDRGWQKLKDALVDDELPPGTSDRCCNLHSVVLNGETHGTIGKIGKLVRTAHEASKTPIILSSPV